MKSQISTLAFLLHLFTMPMFSQVLTSDICLSPVEEKDLIPARPVCGWDSLETKFWFPEIMRRAGIRSVYVFDFSIGSDSTIAQFNPTKFTHFNSEFDVIKVDWYDDATFITMLQNQLKTTKWISALFQGHQCNVKLPIFFNLYGFVRKHGAVANVPLPISVDAIHTIYDNKNSDY